MKNNPYNLVSLEESVAYIRDILQFFPWNEEYMENDLMQSRSMAVQLAAMLSQFCVLLLPDGAARMGFIYNSNSQRSGKTLLAKLAVMPLYGHFRAQGWKSNEEELSKVIDSEILAGSTYICFDNVRGFVASPTLEGLMTTPDWTGRVLGKTQMFTAKNYTTLFITGNKINISPDMNHRCLIVDLYVNEGNVQERSIPFLIDEVWLSERYNRLRILSALYSIVYHWNKAGRPNASSFGYKPRLGFERWGELFGGLVGFSGFGNPLVMPVLDNAGDSVDLNLRLLIAEMNEERNAPKRFRDEAPVGRNRMEFRFQQIVDICVEDQLFDWMIDGKEIDGKMQLKPSSASRFSKFLVQWFPPSDKSQARIHRIDTCRGEEIIETSCIGKGRSRLYVVEKKS